MELTTSSSAVGATTTWSTLTTSIVNSKATVRPHATTEEFGEGGHVSSTVDVRLREVSPSPSLASSSSDTIRITASREEFFSRITPSTTFKFAQGRGEAPSTTGVNLSTTDTTSENNIAPSRGEVFFQSTSQTVDNIRVRFSEVPTSTTPSFTADGSDSITQFGLEEASATGANQAVNSKVRFSLFSRREVLSGPSLGTSLATDPALTPNREETLYGAIQNSSFTTDPALAPSRGEVLYATTPSTSSTTVRGEEIFLTPQRSITDKPEGSMEDLSKGQKKTSPTDTVEKILKKYKQHQVRRHAQPSFATPLSATRGQQLLVEVELWEAINDELQSSGLEPVKFVQVSSSQTSVADHLMLSVSSSSSLRQTVSRLMKEMKQIQQSLKDQKLALTRSAVDSAESSLITELKSKIAVLEYENTRLKGELQNRPALQEMSELRAKLKQLEEELELKREQFAEEKDDFTKCEEHMQDVCAHLSISKGNFHEVLPKIQELITTLENHTHLEKHFSSLIKCVYHPSAPRIADQWEKPVVPLPSGHDLWCEITWNHMVLTLQEWSNHLQGLQELEQVIKDVCCYLDLKPCPEPSYCCNHHTTLQENETEEEMSVSFSCHEMAWLLRRWLLTQSNLKKASLHIPLVMVRYFQHLFRVQRLEGVYPTMSLLSMQLEQNRNIQKRLKQLFNLDDGCSMHKLLSTIEYYALIWMQRT